MTEALCRCDRPIPDTAYVCPRCAAQLRRALELTANLAGEHETTIARLDRVQRRGSHEVEHEWWREPGALYPMPLIVDLDASARYQAALGELTTWARHYTDTRGLTDHFFNPRLEELTRRYGTKPLHPLQIAATILAGSLDWLRYREEAERAWPLLLAACHQLRRIVDTNPERVVGVCDCDRRLYADRIEGTVRCWACGLEHDIADRFAAMMDAARAMRVHPADAADWIAWTEPGTDREKVRNLVKQWAHRDLIEAGADGRYQLGAILDRWTRALAARAA